MKITDRFMGDHKTFRKLISDINQVAAQTPNEWDQKRLVRLVELLKDHFVLHGWGEEVFYFSAVAARISDKGPINKSYLARMSDEHKTLDDAIDELERKVKSKLISHEWPKNYQRLVTDFVAHMDKEESELFPFSEGLLGVAGLEEISNELERRRREAPSIRRHSLVEER
jgi:hemerythrin-like domain-containing protein